jgi:hypothetical protein
MDIGKGLERLAELGVLIVLGSIVATICLAGLAMCLIVLGGHAIRRLRGDGDPGPDEPED